MPDRYLDTPPDLVVEVFSPSDRWPKVLAKVAEYLDAGTTIVLVLDDPRRLGGCPRIAFVRLSQMR